jgi:aspartate racemase
MEQDDIVIGRLRRAYDLDVLVPQGAEFAAIDRIVYGELVRGKFLEPSRALCRAAIAGLVARGCEAVVLGCTEFPLLVKQEDSPVPLFDTTTLHALAAVEMALG